MNDNGHSAETPEAKNCHGLDNMKWRAEVLSADLNIVSDASRG